MSGILRGPRRIALAIITVILAAASLVSLAESYRGLYDWAHTHGLPGGWAAVWPLMVDTFLVVGELALFVALVDRWPTRARIPAWVITLLGLGVSVAGNVGHVHGHSLAVRGTAAVPPLAAAAALAVGLGVLKRTVAIHSRPKVATSGQADTPKTSAKRTPAKPAKVATSTADTEAAVLSALANDRGITNAELAAAVGVSTRTARRYRSRLNGAIST
jgi:Protein of unknown function (DUF2637)/Winged helix-turn-helix DNA-binding